MHHLTAHDILKAWELGQRQHPIDRALTLLSIAHKDIARDKLAALSIGQRDALLVRLREQTFGSTMNGFTRCNQCNESLEFTLSTTDIVTQQESGSITHEKPWELTADDVKLSFRLPDSTDIAAVINGKDTQEARNVIMKRCVLEASRKGTSLSVTELSADMVTRLADYMSACEPQAEVVLDLRCPSCGNKWQTVFDIVSFFWAEICAYAKRLLREVHTLASVYGWSEAEILSMSEVRRQFYLEMAT